MKSFLKAHKRLVLGVLVGLVLLAVWAWFAGQARQQTSFHRTDERIQQAKTYVAKAGTGSRTSRLAAIGSLVNMSRSDTCRGDWWNDWQQTVVQSIKRGAEKCRAKEKMLTAITSAAAAIRRHITDESKLIKLLDGLAADPSVKDWPTKAESAAQSALKAIGGIRVVSSVQPIQKAAKSRLEAIISAWNSLNEASTKQDKTAYLTAESQLKQAYADLAAIADTSDEQLQGLLSRLMTPAKSL